MPNRGELVLRTTSSFDETGGDGVAWTLVWFCAAGWLISVYVAVASQSIETIPTLIAQSPFG